jgi:hypothetical protein
MQEISVAQMFAAMEAATDTDELNPFSFTYVKADGSLKKVARAVKGWKASDATQPAKTTTLIEPKSNSKYRTNLKAKRLVLLKDMDRKDEPPHSYKFDQIIIFNGFKVRR